MLQHHGVVGSRISGKHRIVFNFPHGALSFKVLVSERDRVIIIHFLNSLCVLPSRRPYSVGLCCSLPLMGSFSRDGSLKMIKEGKIDKTKYHLVPECTLSMCGTTRCNKQSVINIKYNSQFIPYFYTRLIYFCES